MWKSSKMHLHETCRKRENKRYSFRRCEVGSVVMSWSVFQSELRGSALSAVTWRGPWSCCEEDCRPTGPTQTVQLARYDTVRCSLRLSCVALQSLRFLSICYASGSQFQSRAPPLCIFRMLLLSLQIVLFERKCPAKWTSQDIPPWFQFEANVYIPFKVLKCARRELKCIYLQRYMMSHSSVREDVAQRKSMNECSEIK